ncbi:hypothetical protein AMTR_s00047p00035280 [Amborella trichopoda]|uniref:Uncharacterized protein n=1 Tax=Amborella trichopoda TaxID=13333 RepID=U5DBE0_AMBTC|nr:hypothetical protein AMTR_s00047p00035280 [Amborella trichopoda]
MVSFGDRSVVVYKAQGSGVLLRQSRRQRWFGPYCNGRWMARPRLQQRTRSLSHRPPPGPPI